MSVCRWIVCESSSRWTSALRVTLARHGVDERVRERVHEVRTLEELSTRVDEDLLSLCLIEVNHNQVGNILRWIAGSRQLRRRLRVVALVDDELLSGSGAQGAESERRDIVAALVEAGAATVVNSPRQLAPLVAMGRRYAAMVAKNSTSDGRNQPFSEWAMSRLPWQEV